MPWLLFAVMALVSALFTIPAVMLIPRVRTSPSFDRFLWIGTWLLAFLCSWLAIAYVAGSGSEPPTTIGDLSQLPLVPIVVGAAGGALALNALLWLLDRLAPPEVEEEEGVDEDELSDGHDGSNISEEPKEE